jgi:hypothetical protein
VNHTVEQVRLGQHSGSHGGLPSGAGALGDREPQQHCGPARGAWVAGAVPARRWQPTEPLAVGRPGAACAGPWGSRGGGRPTGN